MSDQAAVESIEAHCRNFRMAFGSPSGQAVLTYMADFCRAGETCVAIEKRGAPIDIHRTLVLEGRREVFLEIQRFLSLSPEQIFMVATGRPINLGENTDA
jgi:hypothetical protein